MYPCDTIVPEDEIYDGYTKILNGTCTFCSEMCEPPTIDNHIGFFEGFKGKQVAIVYGLLLGLTVVW